MRKTRTVYSSLSITTLRVSTATSVETLRTRPCDAPTVVRPTADLSTCQATLANNLKVTPMPWRWTGSMLDCGGTKKPTRSSCLLLPMSTTTAWTSTATWPKSRKRTRKWKGKPLSTTNTSRSLLMWSPHSIQIPQALQFRPWAG